MNAQGIEAVADRVRRYRNVELGLFALTGERSVSASAGEIAVYLSEASAAHGYRAALFEPLLLVSAGIADRPAEDLSYAKGLDAVFSVLSRLSEAALVTTLSTVIYPQAIASLTNDLEGLSLASNGPLRRVLRRVIFDLGLEIEQAKLLSLSREDGGGGDERVVVALSVLGGLYGE